MTSKLTIPSVFLFALAFLWVPANSIAQDVSFEKDIKPIFENHCISCHGPEKEEGTRLDIRDDAMDYIEAGDAENSSLYEYLISEDEEELMPPPDEENPLSADQISLVANWINSGAEWPEDVKLVDAQADSSDDSSEDTADGAIADGNEPPADGGEEKEGFAKLMEDGTLWNAIGSLHPATLHIPIGLLLAAGLFALFSIRGNFVMSDCAYYCLWLGTIGAIIACVSGWWFSPMENRGTVSEFNDLFNQDHKIFWHRTSALICTAFAFLLCLFAAGARAKDPDEGVLWKIGAMFLALGIAYTGHEGGELTHGKDLYKDLNTVIESVVPVEDFFGIKEAQEGGNAKDESDDPPENDEESDSKIGETSSEDGDGDGDGTAARPQ